MQIDILGRVGIKLLEKGDELQEPLGFERDKPPHATTISRVVAVCELSVFSQAFLAWLKRVIPDVPLIAAVDGKTSCQGLDAEGEPVQLLTVLVHDLKFVLAQWSVRDEKTNEPGVLKNHFAELKSNFPLLKLITGDAIYAQRPLAEAWLDENCDYLVQIKGNQPDIQDAVQQCLGGAHERPPAAETVEKRGLDRSPPAVLDLDNTEYIREQLAFPGCQIALRVDRDVIAEDGTVRLSDSRYFIASVDPSTICAADLLAAVRNHWQVENSVFFIKDRWWDEDRH